MSKKFFTDIKVIRNAIDTNKLVVFVGAGVSIDSGIPGWGTLIDEMKSEIEVPQYEQDYLRIAQMYFNDRQQKEFLDKIRYILKHKKVKYNEIHEEVFRLNPEHILTTNFDDLLEQVIKKRSLPFSVVSKDKEFPYALNTNLLVKVHGDLDNSDIVLTEDDFINYSQDHPLIEAFLKSVFASKVVLFIGYAFSDIDLKMIIQSVRNILGKEYQNAYLLSIDENLHPTQREYLKKKGVNVINYFDALNNNKQNYIIEYLNGNNALNSNYYKKGKNLSTKGQNLLNLINFISVYDKFNEPLTSKNLIEQVYLSLNRFSELRSLPPNFVANLFPFNNSDQYVHNYEPYRMLTRNHNLYDLFFNQINYIDGETKLKPTSDLTESEIKELDNKLKDIVKILNSSLILYLYAENEQPDSLGYRGWSDRYINLQIKEDERCNCVNCRLSRFEINNVITDLANSIIDETTSVSDGLALAYASYKVGNFNHAYMLFEEVADRAWQSGKYISYYIAKHNIKSLRNLIHFYERSLAKEEKKKIIRKLDDIDFDKLLFQIPYLGKFEYEILKAIRDDEVLIKCEKKIYETYDDILEVYESYKDSNVNISGSSYPLIIENELYKIIVFYNNNFIVSDEFNDFKRISGKAIESLFVSYATSADYDSKLKEFNKFFFDVVVLYVNLEDIKNILGKYNIKKIKFKQQEFPKILESVSNFFKSFFEETRFFGYNTQANEIVKGQLTNEFFAEKCRNQFDKILLLLSNGVIDTIAGKDLVTNLIAFIKSETFLRRNDIKYLTCFVYQHHILFTREDYIDILKAIILKLNIYNDGSLLEAVAYSFEEQEFAKIEDKELMYKIYSMSKKPDKGNYSVVSLWSISNDIIKIELKQNIINHLNNNFNNDLYLRASYKHIIDFNDYFEKYISEVNNRKGNGYYTLRAGKPMLQSYEFLNAIIFIYEMDIKSDDIRLTAFTDLADFMKFYLDPVKFDYSGFKVEWLYIIHGRDKFYQLFKVIPGIKAAIENELKICFNAELAEVYTKYFLAG